MKSRSVLASSILVLIAASAIAAWAGTYQVTGRSVPAAAVSPASHDQMLQAYASLPVTFVENRGQLNSRVRYYAQGSRFAFYFTPEEVALSLTKRAGASSSATMAAVTTPAQGIALALQFLGSNPHALVEGQGRAPGETNILRGNDPAGWQTGLASYQQIAYHELWPGVSLTMREQTGKLKYEFRVQPGARIKDIRLDYSGATGLALDRAGGLMIDTALGVLRDAAPVAWQMIGGARVPVESRYALERSGAAGYGFAVGAGYRPDHELIIDPGLDYSTFLGGTSNQTGASIVVDAAGNAYVTGFTQSSNFPTTPGAFDRTGSTGTDVDAFVSKLNPTGTALVYSTFLGGTNFDWGRGITIDAAGNAYVAGQTKSSNFPTTGGAFDRSFNIGNCPRCGIDQYDAFVAKLNPSGSGLVYSTFLGGTDLDDALAIALDSSRNAYVAAQTVSSDFPVKAGSFDTTPNGGQDAVIVKLNTTGSALVYSTRLGGADNELAVGIAVDSSGNAFVGGGTQSADFPTTPGAFDRTQNGGAFDELFDAFFTKLNAAGSGLIYSTFLGGSKSDFVADFAVDAAGNAYIAGATLSPDFPTTPGSFDPVFAGSEGYAAKLNPTGSALVYSTFLGEAGAAAIAPTADGSVWLAGGAGPTAFITPDAFDTEYNGGGSDVYVAKLDSTGSAITFASFLGGSDSEGANDVALDPSGNVYLTGRTLSADFTTTPGAFDRVYRADPFLLGADAFVAKIGIARIATPLPTALPVPAAPTLLSPAAGAMVGQPVTFDWTDANLAVSYTIQVDEISQFGDPLILSTNTTASQFTTSTLPDGKFLRVRGNNSAGKPGAWSDVRAIQVQSTPTPTPPPVPGTPSLVSPANNAQVVQPFTFDWSDVAAAAWYVIEVDDATSFAAPLVWAATTTPSQLATNSLSNGTLFWRVKAFNSDGVGGAYSAVRTVRVQSTAPPTPTSPATPPSPTPTSPVGQLPAPSLVSPSSDARFSPGQSITFDWGDVAGAASYELQIDDSQSFTAPLRANPTTTISQYTTNTLPTTRMWWRVRAISSSGTPGAWSSSRRFEVKN